MSLVIWGYNVQTTLHMPRNKLCNHISHIPWCGTGNIYLIWTTPVLYQHSSVQVETGVSICIMICIMKKHTVCAFPFVEKKHKKLFLNTYVGFQEQMCTVPAFLFKVVHFFFDYWFSDFSIQVWCSRQNHQCYLWKNVFACN